RRHTRFSRDWSSDVCSSDLEPGPTQPSSITQDEEYTIQTYRVENYWGYDILRNNQLFVHQPNIPAISGAKGFNSEEQAISVAQRSEERRVGKEDRSRRPAEH